MHCSISAGALVFVKSIVQSYTYTVFEKRCANHLLSHAQVAVWYFINQLGKSKIKPWLSARITL